MKRLLVVLMLTAAAMWALPGLAEGTPVRPPGIQGGAGANPWWGQSGFEVAPISLPPPGDVGQPGVIYPPKPVCCFVVR